jgi:hypothetical protein
MTLVDSNTAATSRAAALTAVVAACGTLALLAGLHALSPEFAAGQRMLSEYALGAHSWLLSILFAIWAVSSWALALALWPQARAIAGKIGLAFLVLAGVGEAMAAFFDVQHPLHGVAAMIGVPSLPLAALLISHSMVRLPAWSRMRGPLLTTAHLTWISFVLMGAGMAMMLATLGSDGKPGPDTIQLQGWTNRLLVVAYCAWVIVAGLRAKTAGTASGEPRDVAPTN